jgi:hypothetical protein
MAQIRRHPSPMRVTNFTYLGLRALFLTASPTSSLRSSEMFSVFLTPRW